ncbi:putative pentatricopeptide repeat-containing protein [Sesamum alatum]|uniref:Pentatricopeptide repeat-containing protein n=1 Tax=Sesamum alatum TaxID=300844 RepID=A0AAE1YYH5_9LAMI|nr:putative pentatricopeptide repeat-containing protein [Sesamum alatum]
MEDGFSDAVTFYRKMQGLNIEPNLITLLGLLRACLGISALSLIKEIHGFSIRNDMDPHSHLRSGLVEAYGRCGCLHEARLVFDNIKEKDVVAWSSLISAYSLHGQAEKALETFDKMEAANVKADEITFLGVLKACSHAGLADEARMYFAMMRARYSVEPNSDHYACLVDVLSRAGRLYEAYEVLKRMSKKATAKAWGALLGACRTYGEVELAEISGRALLEMEPENPANYVILARIYGSQGQYEKAERLRKEMEERGIKVSPGSSWVVHLG